MNPTCGGTLPWSAPSPRQKVLGPTCMSSPVPVVILLLHLSAALAEKEPRGELWRGQRRGDPGEQAVRGRPRGVGSVHPQGVPHRKTHPVLVLLHPASSCPASGRGVVERVPLHTDPVRRNTCHIDIKNDGWSRGQKPNVSGRHRNPPVH